MSKNTALEGLVGCPTSGTIANAQAQGKRSESIQHLDGRLEVSDDFQEFVRRGISPTTAQRLRRIAHGLSGIREFTKLLTVFEVERQASAELGDAEPSFLSPRATEGVLQGTHVLADLLNLEIYALGADLVRTNKDGDQQ